MHSLTIGHSFKTSYATRSSAGNLCTLLLTLHSKVQGFIPVLTSQHGTQSSSVPSDLHSSQYVFVGRDCHRSPLEGPYEGPFKAIKSFQLTLHVHEANYGRELRLCLEHPNFDLSQFRKTCTRTWNTVYYIVVRRREGGRGGGGGSCSEASVHTSLIT